MAQMPVATLRIWEQRYRAVQPATAPSGHRRYSSSDVQRLLLLRQLTDQGHAIGSIAMLDTAALEALTAELHPAPAGAAASMAARPALQPGPGWTPLRVVVVGPALALRLQRPALQRSLVRQLQVFAVFESLAEVVAHSNPADLLLWHAPVLQPVTPADLRRAQAACGAASAAVVTRFASSGAVQALVDAGLPVLLEPPGDDALGHWLASLAPDASPTRKRESPSPGRPRGDTSTGHVAVRRYDDATLTALVGRLTSVACECPRHLAELLMQVAAFETYSADCADRNPADAVLHADLHALAATTRALFEAALERVARHEGVALR